MIEAVSSPRRARGARVLGERSFEFVLWAPDCGDIVIERVSVEVQEEGGGPRLLVAQREGDGEHWAAALEASSDQPVAYSFVVEGRVQRSERRYRCGVSDPYAREVRRDFASVVRPGSSHTFAPYRRPALRDLLVYELHVYNFTAEDPSVGGPLRGTYRGVAAKLPYLADLGVNAIELMPVFDYSDPWQAGVRWNYITACHLCAPHRGYAADGERPRAEFIELVEACHERGIAVIIDGVFNQVSRRFSYARMYDPAFRHRAHPDLRNNPLLGRFAGTDPNPGSIPFRDKDWGGCDLDYNKPAALDLVDDVLAVWFQELGVDGIRFDHTLGYYVWKDTTKGAGAVAEASLRVGGESSYRIAEHFSSDQNEIELLRDTAFNAEWAKGFFYAIEDALAGRGLEHLEYRMDPRRQGFADHKPPVVFLGSHDDERLARRGGAPWWRAQPGALALYTHPGVPMVYMGDEYGEDDKVRLDLGLPREIGPLDWDENEGGTRLTALFRALGLLRARLPVLREPGFLPIWRYERERILIYGRGEREPTCVVALNFSSEEHAVRVPIPAPDGPWHEFLFNLTFRSRDGHLELESGGAVYDQILIPSWYGHIYCRDKVWTDAEWHELLGSDLRLARG